MGTEPKDLVLNTALRKGKRWGETLLVSWSQAEGATQALTCPSSLPTLLVGLILVESFKGLE